MDELFGIATGWLAWPPSEAWNTPVVEILMAWESRRQFLNNTNPFAAKKTPEKSKMSVADRLKERLRGVRNKG